MTFYHDSLHRKKHTFKKPPISIQALKEDSNSTDKFICSVLPPKLKC